LMEARRRLQVLSDHLRSDSDLSIEWEDTANTQREGHLQGQVAIVTGSGQGIGESTARLFAQEGAKVIVTDLDGEKAKRVADAIKQSGGDAASFAGDVTATNFAKDIVDFTIQTYGKINVVVNNAGFTWDGMIHTMTDKQWDIMLAVHNTAPFRLIRAAAPHMREAAKNKDTADENRSIINVSSTSGLHGNVGQVNYATAKMGIIGLTKTVAKEWGPFGIRCNAIAFGSIDTRLTRAKEKGESIQVDGKEVALGIPEKILNARRDATAVPLRRVGTADEAANSILFLASHLSSYVTGHTLEVTGGMGI